MNGALRRQVYLPLIEPSPKCASELMPHVRDNANCPRVPLLVPDVLMRLHCTCQIASLRTQRNFRMMSSFRRFVRKSVEIGSGKSTPTTVSCTETAKTSAELDLRGNAGPYGS